MVSDFQFISEVVVVLMVGKHSASVETRCGDEKERRVCWTVMEEQPHTPMLF
ncbi:hypothetical protein COCNU_11G013710 [Cocos nucifera]|uniref:Uncharacterized protein n=1 Tax=Cocos nucifera TaxID=13894 RepID=A0A8K0IS51_COCNU|nr:hypothetical protein COCNU_11G013710 [Cocos nucifera]